MSRDVFYDDCSRADECSRTYRHTTNDRSVCANSAPPLQTGRHSFIVALLHSASRISVIRKNAVWSEKHVIIDNHPVEQLHPVLDRNPTPDPDVSFDERMVTNVAISTDHRSGENMGECPNPGPCSNFVSLTESMRVDED
jgi:hypothetical protein